MNATTQNMLFEIQNYFPFHKTRNENGGGVVLLVKENLVCERIKLPPTVQEEELIRIELKIEGKSHYIFCFYNPPQKTLNNKIIEFAEQQGDFILLGDLNCKLREFDLTDNRNGTKLRELIESSKIFILNDKHKPTFFRKYSESWY